MTENPLDDTAAQRHEKDLTREAQPPRDRLAEGAASTGGTTMGLSISEAHGRVPVTILGIHGVLDASNYEKVIAQARQLYDAGTRDFLVDMSDLTFLSSAGLIALHSIVLLLRRQPPPDPEAGWQAFHTLDHDRDSGVQPQVKLLNPQPRIRELLKMVGMDVFFEIYDDREAAIASF